MDDEQIDNALVEAVLADVSPALDALIETTREALAEADPSTVAREMLRALVVDTNTDQVAALLALAVRRLAGPPAMRLPADDDGRVC